MKKHDRPSAKAESRDSRPADREARSADRSPIALSTCLAEAARLTRFLPRTLLLLPGERMIRGPYIFLEATRLVRAVAEALEQRPDLFAHMQIDPALLRQRQRTALHFQALQTALLDLAKLAEHGYMRYQSDATQGAMLIVRAVRADAQHPMPTKDQQDRIDLLRRAERVLSQKQQRRVKTRLRSEKLAGAPVPAKRTLSNKRSMKDARNEDLAQIASDVAQNMKKNRRSGQ